MNVNFEDTEEIRCEECNCQFFHTTFTIRKVPALMSPTGREVMIPMQLFQCAECQHTNKSFLNDKE